MSTGEGVSFVMVGAATGDILGWNASELIGRQLSKFVVDGSAALFDEIRLLTEGGGIPSPRRVYCKMRHKNGSIVDIVFVLYQPGHDTLLVHSIKGVIQAPLIYQLRLAQSFESPHQTSTSLAHPLTANIFEPLDMSRDSSWQYELQQIRFANQRLTDEITALERQLKEAEDKRRRVSQHNVHDASDHYAQTNHHHNHHNHQVDNHLTSHHHHHRQHYAMNSEQVARLQNPPVHHGLPHYSLLGQGTFPYSPQPQRAPPAMPISHEWDASLFTQHNQPDNNPRLQGLKRSWDVATHQ